MSVSFIGILNCTPDSFSDGGLFNAHDLAVKQGRELFKAGADIVDIGGDASGPGSNCVGPEIEWTRISEVISSLTQEGDLSVDTHSASTAGKAVDLGVKIINDVYAGRDPAMFEMISSNPKVKIILMYSCWQAPHKFMARQPGSIASVVKNFLSNRIEAALSQGVADNQIIVDPGMGAFLSSDRKDSWDVLDHLDEFGELGYPLVVGISRKSFLKSKNSNIFDLDLESAKVAFAAWEKMLARNPVFFRVHNVVMHKQIFAELN